jgi:hypothetical protein
MPDKGKKHTTTIIILIIKEEYDEGFTRIAHIIQESRRSAL